MTGEIQIGKGKIRGSRGDMALLLGPMMILLLFAVFIDSTEFLGFSWGLFPDFFFGLWMMVKPKQGETESEPVQDGSGDEEGEIIEEEREEQRAVEEEEIQRTADESQDNQPAKEKTKDKEPAQEEAADQKQKNTSTKNESANKAERAESGKPAEQPKQSSAPKTNEPPKQAKPAPEPAHHEPKHAKPQPAASRSSAKNAKMAKKGKWLKKIRYFTFISDMIPGLSMLPMWVILVWSEITSI